MKSITVVAAVFRKEEQLLIARRKAGKSMAGYWELPGGKVEEGEAPETALQRELKEELGINASIGAHVITVEHDYPEVHVRLLVYFAETQEEITHSSDHDQLEWVFPKDCKAYSMAAADIPVVEALCSGRK